MSIDTLRGVIDDGTREIPLVNKFGKLICNIYIRPADLSILDRYNAFAADFKSIVEPVKDLKINVDGTAKFEEEWAALEQVEAELKRRINALFDMDEADAIFAKRHPFSSVGGKFFCEAVMEVVGNIILEAITEELELSNQRVEKYMADIQPINPEVSGYDGTVTADDKGL